MLLENIMQKQSVLRTGNDDVAPAATNAPACNVLIFKHVRGKEGILEVCHFLL